MTREEAIKKIESIFTECNDKDTHQNKLWQLAYDSVQGYEYEMDSADEVKATFLSYFREEIEQVVDMFIEKTKPSEAPTVGMEGLKQFKAGDIIYVYGNDDYWPAVLRLPEDFEDQGCFDCDMVVNENGAWDAEDRTSIDVFDTMICRYATDEEIMKFHKFFK